MARVLKCKINYNRPIAQKTYLLGLKTDKKLKLIPGQFFMVRVKDGLDPFLARPLAWFNYLERKNLIELVYQVVGRGTSVLSERKAGENITILGPLGKGFDLKKVSGKTMLVGGGVGIPGLWNFCRRFSEKRGCDLTLVWGAKTKNLFFLRSRIPKGIRFIPVTEDGSLGRKGLATDIVLEIIEQDGKPDSLFGCGPKAMLKKLAEICRAHRIPGEVLFEERMACGVGACLGCAVPASGGGYLRCCQEGPAFGFEEIDWERVRW